MNACMMVSLQDVGLPIKDILFEKYKYTHDDSLKLLIRTLAL